MYLVSILSAYILHCMSINNIVIWTDKREQQQQKNGQWYCKRTRQDDKMHFSSLILLFLNHFYACIRIMSILRLSLQWHFWTTFVFPTHLINDFFQSRSYKCPTIFFLHIRNIVLLSNVSYDLWNIKIFQICNFILNT